jgi:hypothetical protein
MMKIIAAAAFAVAPWQPAHARAIVGSIPEEFRGEWCQETTKGNFFKPGGCKLKAGSLSIDRMTLDTGRLSCGFDRGRRATEPSRCGCSALILKTRSR